MDIMDHIYMLIKDDALIKSNVDKFMYNDMPDLEHVSTAHIAINPVVNGAPVSYSDGRRMADAKSARVDVLLKHQSKNGNSRLLIASIMECIASILDDNGYGQTASFSPEYNKEYGVYRESRSFEINYYRSDY